MIIESYLQYILVFIGCFLIIDIGMYVIKKVVDIFGY